MEPETESKDHNCKEFARKLRNRERRRYTEELADEEIEGRRMFSVEDKLYSSNFDFLFVKEMKGDELNLKYFQEHGFDSPILVKSKTGLGIKMPEKSFGVNDVKQCVGSRRVVDVMDVSTQKNIEMTVKEWCRYYENPNREKLLNIISLEFSHTKLESLVESPTIVRQVDWVDWVWPKHLKHLQTESTNSIDDMKYPKVQKYCLMSVKGCYTDFHIDFGGTSVWYHILKGQKVFWLIPPSERNIQLYEQWVLSGKQTDIFFGDTVDQCARIRLNEGFTFFIPTGWIHAVYTPEDSLVFGGNFLHSFGIEKQLRIAQVEDITKVPSKFRYPFYSEILWYVLQRYVYCLTGKNHLSCNEEGTALVESNVSGTLSSYSNHITKVKNPSESVHLTSFELNGLKSIIMWLSRLSPSKRSVPELILNSEALLNDAKLLVDDHVLDDTRLACTGKSVLFWNSKQKNIATTSCAFQTSTSLSVTAQLRQIKNSSFNSSLKHSSKINFGNQASDTSPKRPESPPTRPLSSDQYSVAVANFSKPLEEIPSSFAELIAATEVGNPNRTNICAVTSSSATHVITSSTTSTMTQTTPLNVSVVGQDIVSQVISKDVTSSANLCSAISINHSVQSNKNNSNDNSRRRRTRCKKCDACLRADCGECHFCKDMKKFGGPGRMKQSCIARQCMAPVLPHTACCMICGRDGWEKLISGVVENETQSSLMECSKCWEIAHPICLKEKNSYTLSDGIISDELPNSWECPKCVSSGKQAGTAKIRPKPLSASLSVSNPIKHVSNSLVSFSSIDTMNKMCVENASDETANQANDTDEDSGNSEHSDLSMNQSLNHCSIPSSPSSTRHSHAMKPCVRFPLLQEAIKQQQEEQKHSTVKHTKIQCESKSSLTKTRRNNESSRDRLFRSLKGLKRSSELMRFAVGANHTSQAYSVKKTCQPKSLSSLQPHRNDVFCENMENVTTKVCISDQNTDRFVQRSNSSPLEFDEDTDNDTDENYASADTVKCNTYESRYLSSPSSSSDSDSTESSVKKVRLSDSVCDSNNRQRWKPQFVVRPAPLEEDISESEDDADKKVRNDDDSGDNAERQKSRKNYFKKLKKTKGENLCLERDVILPVLPYLCRKDLMNCMLVCKVWNGWCLDPKLWKKLDLTRKKITANSLIGLVRRQPLELNLSWSNISKRQLSWLIARLPQLQSLSLAGCASSIVNALCTCNCPLLKMLDLSWVDSLCDNLVRELLAPPLDSRPGVLETKTRLRHLTEIKLSGSSVSDVSIRLMSHHLPQLSAIDLSNCQKVSDMGIAVLGAAKSSKLTSLKLSSCANISDTSLDALKRCQHLRHLDLRDCSQVSIGACHKFIVTVNTKSRLTMKLPKLLESKSS